MLSTVKQILLCAIQCLFVPSKHLSYEMTAYYQVCPREWDSHGKHHMGWDGTGINCYGMGMGQINMSHGQP